MSNWFLWGARERESIGQRVCVLVETQVRARLGEGLTKVTCRCKANLASRWGKHWGEICEDFPPGAGNFPNFSRLGRKALMRNILHANGLGTTTDGAWASGIIHARKLGITQETTTGEGDLRVARPKKNHPPMGGHETRPGSRISVAGE